MKLMIASDIHGSAYYCRKMLEAYKREDADRLLLLGDILYHGPRNDLPKDYNPKEVIAMLNPMKQELLCVRGNCDTEVDQMVLDFPVMADYALILYGERNLYATHGHIYNENNLPPLKNGDILRQSIFLYRAWRDFVSVARLVRLRENAAHVVPVRDQTL